MASRGERAERGGPAPAGAVRGAAAAPGPPPPAPGAPRDWAGGLPPELLEAVARAVPAEDRLWFRLVCQSWGAAGAAVAAVPGQEPLRPGKVTRTRGVDAAAGVARAVKALGVLEGPAKGRFKSGLCAYAALGRHLAVLQWARAEGCY